ncbi:transposase [Janibacter alittae]|uniref:transposase n=1 Tax=Janibacter alittae TaxID=3115209 RepID=UPI003BAE339E
MQRTYRWRIRTALPKVKISADHWHVIRLANEMVTKVRRRRIWELHQRRGRNIDTAYRYRKLLTCAADRLSVRQRTRLNQLLQEDIEPGRRVGHQRTRAPTARCPRHGHLPA